MAAPLEIRCRRKALANIVLPLFIASVLAFLDRNNLSYAALTMNNDLGFDARMFGFGAGIFFAGYVLFEIPGALIAERFSPKWWLARIMISWGILTGLMAFITTEMQFYVVRFLIGAAEASLYPVCYACVIPRWFSSEERPRAIALLLTSLQISSIVGAPLAGWLISRPILGLKGWQALFLIEAIPAIGFGMILTRWMADSPRDARWLTPEEKQFLTERNERERELANRIRKFSLWQALRDPEVLKLCAIYFLWMNGFWGFNYWMPTVLKAASGWTNAEVGWMIVPPMCLSLGVMMWVGHHSSRTGEKRWHGASGLFLAAAGMKLGTMTQDPALAYICLCMAAIGVYAPMGVWWSYPTSFLTGAAAAGAVGLINSFGNTGGFLGPYLTGYIKESTGSYANACNWLAAALAVAGSMILTCRRSPAAERPKRG